MNCDLQTENPLFVDEMYIVRWFCPPREWWQKSMLILWVDLYSFILSVYSVVVNKHSRCAVWWQLLCYVADRLGIRAVGQLRSMGRGRILMVLCVFLIYEVLRLISIQFLPLSTENRVNGLAWLTFFKEFTEIEHGHAWHYFENKLSILDIFNCHYYRLCSLNYFLFKILPLGVAFAK